MLKFLIPIGGLIAFIVVILTILFIFLKINTLHDIDSCLDSGKQWIEQTGTCGN